MDANLQRLQETELEMLDELMRLCDKHNIHYVMMGGSCLGAIRHHGMIPWDDDIDVGMDRKDYNRFIQICKEELDKKYFFQHFESEEHCGYIFGKIRKNNTYMSEEYSKNVDMHQGIWIDVFPFDYVKDELKEFQKDYKKVLFYRNLLIIKEGFVVKEDASKAVKASYGMVKSVQWALSAKKLKSKLMHLMTKYNDHPTHTLFPYGCAWAEKERISKDEFYDTVLVSFNGRKVPVFRSFDAYLTRMYGNYMKFPPKDKQNSGHDLSQIQF